MTESTTEQSANAYPVAVDALLETSLKIPYVYSALLEFSGNIDPKSATTRAAFEKPIARRRSQEFTNLYVDCGMADQLPGTWVLAEGTPL